MFLPFNYHKPVNIEDFIEITKSSENPGILAGGTDLLVKMKDGNRTYSDVIDIKSISIPEMREIKKGKDFIDIGGLVTMTELATSPLIKKLPVLHQAASIMGCYEIRNRATIGGNVCNGSPGAETGSPLVALDTMVVVDGINGRKEMHISEFYTGPGKVALVQGEILVKFRIPVENLNCVSRYYRRSRTKGMDLAALNFAIVIQNPENNSSRKVKIAMGAVLPTPARINNKIEKALDGNITEELIKKLKKDIAASLNPRKSSIRATPEYKKAMAGEFLELAIREFIFKK